MKPTAIHRGSSYRSSQLITALFHAKPAITAWRRVLAGGLYPRLQDQWPSVATRLRTGLLIPTGYADSAHGRGSPRLSRHGQHNPYRKLLDELVLPAAPLVAREDPLGSAPPRVHHAQASVVGLDGTYGGLPPSCRKLHLMAGTAQLREGFMAARLPCRGPTGNWQR